MKYKSIAELLEMKTQKEKEANEVFEAYIPSLDTMIKYKKATRVEMMQAQKLDFEYADAYLVYTHITDPNLGDSKLQSEFNTGKEPYKIVDALFTPKEVNALSLSIVGDYKGDLLKEVKN